MGIKPVERMIHSGELFMLQISDTNKKIYLFTFCTMNSVFY